MQWVERVDAIWSLIVRLYGLVAIAGGLIGGAIFTTWSLIAGLAAPFIGLIGLGAFLAVSLSMLWGVLGIRRLRARDNSYASKSYFKGEKVYIADFIEPEKTAAIRGKTFEDCEIWGPAVLEPAPGTVLSGTIVGNHDQTLISIPDSQKFQTMGYIPVQGCIFKNCRMIRISLAGSSEMIEKAKKALQINPPADQP
jgi:hypothetical protein